MQAEMLLFLCAHHFNFLSVSMWMEGYMLQALSNLYLFRLSHSTAWPFCCLCPHLVRHWLPPRMFRILWNKCWARGCFLRRDFSNHPRSTSLAAQVPSMGMTVSNQGSACQCFSCDPKKQPPVPPTESWLSTGMFLQARDFAVSPHSV